MLVAAVLLAVQTVPSPVSASSRLYFPPELVSTEPGTVADISRFETPGVQPPGSYPVDIYINGRLLENRTVRFAGVTGDDKAAVRDDTGLAACLTVHDLQGMGVNTEAFPAFGAVMEGQCISPGRLIPEAFTRFDFQKMRLDVSIPQAAMLSRARGYIPPERWDEGINAALINYAFNGSSSHGRYGNSNSRYLRLSSGLNLGPWRLRDERSWNEYDSQYYRYTRWEHTRTYAERDIIPLRSSLIVGDSTTGGELFDSLGLRGIQLATDDSMYPDSQRGFAPVVRGTATTNARVTIRQNGYTVYQTFVSPGAFTIDDLYPVYTSGDLEVTVTEADGSRRVFMVPYSSVPVLQREGRLKYTLAAGQLQSSGDRYDTPAFAQGTLLWGLPHNLTTYAGAQYSKRYLSVQLGTGVNLGMLGAFSADITQARSRLADDSSHQGQSLRFLYARSLSSLGTTFQLIGYRYSTRGFHTLDETALKAMEGWRYDPDTVDAGGRPVRHAYSDYYNLYNSRRARIQASISQRLGDSTSVFLTGVRQSYWNTSGNTDSLQAGLSSTLGSMSYSLTYSYSRQAGQQMTDRSAFFSLSVPLDGLLSGAPHSLYATYSAGRDDDGEVSHQAGLSGTALEGDNLNWSVSQGYMRRGGNSGSLSASYLGGYGNGELGYSYSDSYRQVSYGVSGGVLLHSHGVTLGQPVGDTSVLIAAPGVSGASVENETGVRTDWRGYAIKPYASVYRENRVALDTTSLDDRTDIDDAVRRVVPTRGAVVRADFKARIGSRVLMTLLKNGRPLPFGTVVTAGGSSGIVSDDGLVYLSGMPPEGRVLATWGRGAGEQCSVHYRLPESRTAEPVVRLTAACR